MRDGSTCSFPVADGEEGPLEIGIGSGNSAAGAVRVADGAGVPPEIGIDIGKSAAGAVLAAGLLSSAPATAGGKVGSQVNALSKWSTGKLFMQFGHAVTITV